MVGLSKRVTLEGNYSDWSIYDTFQDPDAYLLESRSCVFNKNETVMLVIDYQRKTVKRYTVATKTLSAILISNVVFLDDPWEISIKSVQGTYVTIIENYNVLHIFKNGVVVKTLTDADLGFVSNEILTASISPSGKYIAVTGEKPPSGVPYEQNIVVLVGS